MDLFAVEFWAGKSGEVAVLLKRWNSMELIVALLALVLTSAPSLHASTKVSDKHKKSPTHSKSSSKTHVKRSRHKGSWKRHGQQAVDVRRTQQIQGALIQSHYLDGEPSGAWDSKTQEALRRYQSANGWQTKVVPDSRALIKLGLGPSTEKLLNPESAMTSHIQSAPPAPATTPAATEPATPQ